MTCEQCGNEFYKGRNVEKEDKSYIQCPYCKYLNERVFYKKKKARRTEQGKDRREQKHSW